MTTRSEKKYHSSTRDKTMEMGAEQAAASVEEMMKLLIKDRRKQEEQITEEHRRQEIKQVLEERECCEKEIEQRMREIHEQIDALSKLVGGAS